MSEPVVDHEQWLTPGVRGIGVASLLSDLGHEIPTSLLPSLLTSTLGAPASALGLIEGISDGAAGIDRFAGGALADDPHRRRTTAVGGYASTAVLTAATGGATAAWQVGLLRTAGWTARGLRVPARNALLADVVAPTRYGAAYGFERMMDNFGAIGGPLLAIGLVTTVGIGGAIGLSVIPGLLAVVAIMYAIRHTPAPTVRERRPIRIQVRPVLQGPLRRLFVGIGAFEAGNVAATRLILRATEQLQPGRSDTRATPQRHLLRAEHPPWSRTSPGTPCLLLDRRPCGSLAALARPDDQGVDRGFAWVETLEESCGFDRSGRGPTIARLDRRERARRAF